MISISTTSLINIEEFKTNYPFIPEITAIRTSLIELFHRFAKTVSLSQSDYLQIKRNVFRIFKLSYYQKDISSEKIESIRGKLLSFEEELRVVYKFNLETVFQNLHHLSHNPHRENIDTLVTIPKAKKAIAETINDYCLQLRQFASVALIYLKEENKTPLKNLLLYVSKVKSPKDFSLSQTIYSDSFANSIFIFTSALEINKTITLLLASESKTKLIELNTTFLGPIQNVTRDLLLKYQEMKTRYPFESSLREEAL